jgi:hypothetical protein
MKGVEKILDGDDGERLWKHVAELESKNCKLKSVVAEAAKVYDVLQLANVSLLDERNDTCYKCEDLEAEVKKVHSDSAMRIAALEAKVNSVKAHNKKVATASNNCLSDYETELTRDLVGLQKLYVCNVQSIGGLCSPMPEGDLSAMDYICWLSAEVASLPEMLASVNENFIFTVDEGTLMMAHQSVDLGALQDAAAVSKADILPMERDVQRATHTVSKKWWHSFGYDYVLCAIRAKLLEVTTDV